MIIPIIETERLILRGHEPDDLDESLKMWTNEIVTRFTTGTKSTRQQTWSRLLSYRGHWSFLGFGFWAIEEKNTKKYIGDIGFAEFKRAIEPAVSDPEMGWALMPEAHGMGYATEAAFAAIRWADNHLKTARTFCIIDPENKASIKIAEKLAFKWELDTTYLDKKVGMYFRAKK